jgi:hypothetical protein
MNHPAILDYTRDVVSSQSPSVPTYQNRRRDSINDSLKEIINSLVDSEFRYFLHGSKHQVGAGCLTEILWKAYLLSFIQNMDCTNDLIRRLEENPSFADICGFDMTLPHH